MSSLALSTTATTSEPDDQKYHGNAKVTPQSGSNTSDLFPTVNHHRSSTPFRTIESLNSKRLKDDSEQGGDAFTSLLRSGSRTPTAPSLRTTTPTTQLNHVQRNSQYSSSGEGSSHRRRRRRRSSSSSSSSNSSSNNSSTSSKDNEHHFIVHEKLKVYRSLRREEVEDYRAGRPLFANRLYPLGLDQDAACQSQALDGFHGGVRTSRPVSFTTERSGAWRYHHAASITAGRAVYVRYVVSCLVERGNDFYTGTGNTLVPYITAKEHAGINRIANSKSRSSHRSNAQTSVRDGEVFVFAPPGGIPSAKFTVEFKDGKNMNPIYELDADEEETWTTAQRDRLNACIERREDFVFTKINASDAAKLNALSDRLQMQRLKSSEFRKRDTSFLICGTNEGMDDTKKMKDAKRWQRLMVPVAAAISAMRSKVSNVQYMATLQPSTATFSSNSDVKSGKTQNKYAPLYTPVDREDAKGDPPAPELHYWVGQLTIPVAGAQPASNVNGSYFSRFVNSVSNVTEANAIPLMYLANLKMAQEENPGCVVMHYGGYSGATTEQFHWDRRPHISHFTTDHADVAREASAFARERAISVLSTASSSSSSASLQFAQAGHIIEYVVDKDFQEGEMTLAQFENLVIHMNVGGSMNGRLGGGFADNDGTVVRRTKLYQIIYILPRNFERVVYVPPNDEAATGQRETRAAKKAPLVHLHTEEIQPGFERRIFQRDGNKHPTIQFFVTTENGEEQCFLIRAKAQTAWWDTRTEEQRQQKYPSKQQQQISSLQSELLKLQQQQPPQPNQAKAELFVMLKIILSEKKNQKAACAFIANGGKGISGFSLRNFPHVDNVRNGSWDPPERKRILIREAHRKVAQAQLEKKNRQQQQQQQQPPHQQHQHQHSITNNATALSVSPDSFASFASSVSSVSSSSSSFSSFSNTTQKKCVHNGKKKRKRSDTTTDGKSKKTKT
jgi:hypothetical protein